MCIDTIYPPMAILLAGQCKGCLVGPLVQNEW